MKHDFENHLQSGFSLIEVIIIVLIISILVVASVPQVTKQVRLYNLEVVSSMIADRLLEARITALKHNRPAWLSIDKNARTLNIYTTNDANQNIQRGVSARFPASVTIDPSAPANVTFTSVGRNQANSEILLKLKTSDNKACRMVIVSAVGKTSSVPC